MLDFLEPCPAEKGPFKGSPSEIQVFLKLGLLSVLVHNHDGLKQMSGQQRFALW